jgi:hypothetical protein
MAHPGINFIFVEVDKYTGPGSSLVYSISCAKKYLQKPFIFHACDTIADGIPQSVENNWISAYSVENADQYRTLNLDSNLKFSGFNEKGQIGFDYAYPGVSGIKDFKQYWKIVDSLINNPEENSTSDCDIINKMIKENSIIFDIHLIKNWYDVGNVYELEKTRKYFQDEHDILDKPQENIYFINNDVIKFFYDPELVEKRVKRSNLLKGLVPEVKSSSKKFFKYKFEKGSLFSKTVNPRKMRNFLHWSNKELWKVNSDQGMLELCKNFYIKKTMSRVEMFLEGRADCEIVINGEKIPPVRHMLELIDLDWLCNGIPSLIHGDFILDNVIEIENGFKLIDWRQDFGTSIVTGDIYYDLAKMNHNLVFNHEIVKSGNFKILESNVGIECDILCSKNLLDCRLELHDFIVRNNFDLERVEMLTSIIWINMSPLHEHPIDKFLFNFGKYNLYRQLTKRGKL